MLSVKLLVVLCLANAKQKRTTLFPDHSFQLHLPSAEDANFANWFKNSVVEQRIGEVVARLLGAGSPYGYTRENWTFVDAGMNRGFQTLLPAELGYEVLAIEAMPTCTRQASTTFRLNNLSQNVNVVLAGIAPHNSGTMAVKSDAACNAANTIVEAADHEAPRPSFMNRIFFPSADIQVPLRSLSSLLSPLTKGVAVLKMDIEGSEMAALNSFGLTAFAQHRVNHMIVEICSHLWKHSLDHGVRFFEGLAAISEGAYCLDPEPGCLFKTGMDKNFGTVHRVVDMKKTIVRVAGKSCCGNIWFRGIVHSVDK